MKLSRTTVLAFNEFKRLKYDDPNIRITNGYLLGVAYKSLIPVLSSIEWEQIVNEPIQNVTVNEDQTVEGVKTTLNLEQTVLDGIESLQKEFLTVFKAKRIHKAFVVKMVMLAAIKKINDDLN